MSLYRGVQRVPTVDASVLWRAERLQSTTATTELEAAHEWDRAVLDSQQSAEQTNFPDLHSKLAESGERERVIARVVGEVLFKVVDMVSAHHDAPAAQPVGRAVSFAAGSSAAPMLPYQAQSGPPRALPRDDFGEQRNLHVERPDRVSATYELLRNMGLLEHMSAVAGREASTAEISLCHQASHIEQICSATPFGEGVDDMYKSDGTAVAAKVAVGTTVDVAVAVATGKVKNGVALVRPPGHHSCGNTAMGFCCFNNIAVAVKVLQREHGIKRILILDWDIHHGNGSQEIFYRDASVLPISIHRHDTGFFPESGGVAEVGGGLGVGFNVNIAWSQRGMTDADYLAAFSRVVMPIAREYAPEIVLVSAGFDSGAGDPLGECFVSPAGFAHMTHMLKSVANGKMALVLEGGYNLRTIGRSLAACAEVLLGSPPQACAEHIPSAECLQDLMRAEEAQAEHWNCMKLLIQARLRKRGSSPVPMRIPGPMSNGFKPPADRNKLLAEPLTSPPDLACGTIEIDDMDFPDDGLPSDAVLRQWTRDSQVQFWEARNDVWAAARPQTLREACRGKGLYDGGRKGYMVDRLTRLEFDKTLIDAIEWEDGADIRHDEDDPPPEEELRDPRFPRTTLPDGHARVGMRVGVYWGGDKCWYDGAINEYDDRSQKYRVVYDDGQELWEERTKHFRVVQSPWETDQSLVSAPAIPFGDEQVAPEVIERAKGLQPVLPPEDVVRSWNRASQEAFWVVRREHWIGASQEACERSVGPRDCESPMDIKRRCLLTDFARSLVDRGADLQQLSPRASRAVAAVVAVTTASTALLPGAGVQVHAVTTAQPASAAALEAYGDDDDDWEEKPSKRARTGGDDDDGEYDPGSD